MFTTNDTTVNSVIEDKTKIAQLEKELLSLKQQTNSPCARSSDHVRQFRTIPHVILSSYSHLHRTENVSPTIIIIMKRHFKYPKSQLLVKLT